MQHVDIVGPLTQGNNLRGTQIANVGALGLRLPSRRNAHCLKAKLFVEHCLSTMRVGCEQVDLQPATQPKKPLGYTVNQASIRRQRAVDVSD